MSVIASGVFGVDAQAYDLEEDSDFVKAAKGVQVCKHVLEQATIF